MYILENLFSFLSFPLCSFLLFPLLPQSILSFIQKHPSDIGVTNQQPTYLQNYFNTNHVEKKSHCQHDVRFYRNPIMGRPEHGNSLLNFVKPFLSSFTQGSPLESLDCSLCLLYLYLLPAWTLENFLFKIPVTINVWIE